jgi:hypothetical protein
MALTASLSEPTSSSSTGNADSDQSCMPVTHIDRDSESRPERMHRRCALPVECLVVSTVPVLLLVTECDVTVNLNSDSVSLNKVPEWRGTFPCLVGASATDSPGGMSPDVRTNGPKLPVDLSVDP